MISFYFVNSQTSSNVRRLLESVMTARVLTLTEVTTVLVTLASRDTNVTSVSLYQGTKHFKTSFSLGFFMNETYAFI